MQLLLRGRWGLCTERCFVLKIPRWTVATLMATLLFLLSQNAEPERENGGLNQGEKGGLHWSTAKLHR